MIRFRTAAAAVLVLSPVVLPAPGPAALAVEQHRAPSLSQPQAFRTPAEQRVDTFFAAYRDAVLRGEPEAARTVRQKYLTAELNARLDQWAQANDADPVFRAQDVPVGWTVAQDSSGAGHTAVLLTEHWGDGSTTPVEYQLRLPDLVIDDLENAPA
ncbi:hypothetical protein TR51_08990 [Kitasatospora griseola]|uniref:Uncharacterized protein n=1 Tax=Kitasatospora griseola TaxID=2064 RepID=A0A0D0NZ07_KITGR|nr:hypothetical protein [Kitasatospora griseola]KIQ64441.1 hypothetical protein TR51_08990 [Kitasatospora griseola]